MSTGALCTVVSGLPGSGKTAYAVDLILEFLDKEPDRPVFAMGVNGLKLPHQLVPVVKEWTRIEPHPDDPSIDFPVYNFPKGALIVIDEAQNVFRPRSASARVPDHVAAMERHRHDGLDFVLITQFPTFLDQNIRKLTGRHIHLRSLWNGGELLEWPECSDPSSVTDRNRATRRRYSPPKRVFDLYVSSSMHVKRQRRIPRAVWFFAALVIGGVALGIRFSERVSSALDGTPPGVAAVSVPGGGQVGSHTLDGLSQSSEYAPRPVSGSSPDDYVPRIPARPETAPLYDQIRVVKVMPVVSGCVAMADRCKCFTGQGTDAFLSPDQCREWLKNPPFDPFREAARAPAAPGGLQDRAAPPDLSPPST